VRRVSLLVVVGLVVFVSVVSALVGDPGRAVSSVRSISRGRGVAPCTGQSRPALGNWRVVVVVLENHSYGDVVGASPYLNRLARECALATDDVAVSHPSLPNYLALTSGDTDGISSDCTSCSVHARSIFEQLHGDWRSYLESMPSPGFQGAFAGEYAKKHNPASYYTPIAAAYKTNAVPLGSVTTGGLARDLKRNRLKRFSLIVPNLCHDEHDCPTLAGDRWLRTWIPPILASSAYRNGRTALFVTYDEGIGSDNRVYTVAVNPSIKPATIIRTPLNHYSLLKTSQQLLALPCLAHTCDTTTNSITATIARTPR
jgi:hypothetical protein